MYIILTFLATFALGTAVTASHSLAEDTTFTQKILPLDCVFETVNDGTGTLHYLTPAQCGIIIGTPPDTSGTITNTPTQSDYGLSNFAKEYPSPDTQIVQDQPHQKPNSSYRSIPPKSQAVTPKELAGLSGATAVIGWFLRLRIFRLGIRLAQLLARALRISKP